MHDVSNGDLLIFVWLVFTWFFEGHHKRCSVAMICSKCGEHETHTCTSDRRQGVDKNNNAT